MDDLDSADSVASIGCSSPMTLTLSNMRITSVRRLSGWSLARAPHRVQRVTLLGWT